MATICSKLNGAPGINETTAGTEGIIAFIRIYIQKVVRPDRQCQILDEIVTDGEICDHFSCIQAIHRRIRIVRGFFHLPEITVSKEEVPVLIQRQIM